MEYSKKKDTVQETEHSVSSRREACGYSRFSISNRPRMKDTYRTHRIQIQKQAENRNKTGRQEFKGYETGTLVSNYVINTQSDTIIHKTQTDMDKKSS